MCFSVSPLLCGIFKFQISISIFKIEGRKSSTAPIPPPLSADVRSLPECYIDLICSQLGEGQTGLAASEDPSGDSEKQVQEKAIHAILVKGLWQSKGV